MPLEEVIQTSTDRYAHFDELHGPNAYLAKKMLESIAFRHEFGLKFPACSEQFCI
jgi:hypothetical protein